MSIIKHFWLDILVAAVIAVAVFTELEYAWWAVAIYTPLMALLKLVAFMNRHAVSRLKQKDVGVPKWIYHVLYAINVALLVYDRWWWAAGLWVIIWVLSALIQKALVTKS
jgi:hypothetical protein